MNGDDNVLFCYRFCEINSGLWDNAGEYFISTHSSTNLFFSFFLKQPKPPHTSLPLPQLLTYFLKNKYPILQTIFHLLVLLIPKMKIFLFHRRKISVFWNWKCFFYSFAAPYTILLGSFLLIFRLNVFRMDISLATAAPAMIRPNKKHNNQ